MILFLSKHWSAYIYIKYEVPALGPLLGTEITATNFKL